MDVWSWICDLPSSSEWIQSNSSHFIHQLTSSTNLSSSKPNPTQSILLKVERSSESSVEKWINFSICIQGFHSDGVLKTIWLSDRYPLSSDLPFLPLVLQLVQEIINRAPITYHDHIQQGSQVKLKLDPVAWVLQTHSPESFSGFFDLLLLTRLFSLCACDSPSDVGSLYFHSLLAPNLEVLSRDRHLPVLKAFMTSVGVDVELRLSRAIGYMLSKWLIAREMRVGLPSLVPLPPNHGLSYASEACGLWLMKGYTPIWAMHCTRSNNKKEGYPFVDAKESALKYALAHQQLEAHIQFEYRVEFHDTHIQVITHVDNIRIHVVKLGFNNNINNNNDNDNVDFREELYFPSRIEFWVGPEPGSNYVAGLSLGKSTENIERENETQKVVKGSFGKTKRPKLKTTSRISTKTKMKNWRWDQDVEGNTAIFDGVLYENTSGIEVHSARLVGGASVNVDGKKLVGDDLVRRYSRVNRPFMKSGGIVFARKEYGEEVRWRLSKEMEGSVLKWRMGGKVWVSYWPSEVKNSYYESRCVEWNDEVDLPLIPTKLLV